MKLNLFKFKKGEIGVNLIILALGAILLVAFFLYSQSSTNETKNSMNNAIDGLDYMVDKLNE